MPRPATISPTIASTSSGSGRASRSTCRSFSQATRSGGRGPHLLGALLIILRQRKMALTRGVGQRPLGGEFLARRLAVEEMNARVHHALPKTPPATFHNETGSHASFIVR